VHFSRAARARGWCAQSESAPPLTMASSADRNTSGSRGAAAAVQRGGWCPAVL
jgi:hypothetical protein